MKRWIWVPIVLVGAGLIAWTQMGGGQAVETAAVTRGTVRAMVEELGETRLPRTHVISMPVDGRLLPIELSEGDVVTAGQVVARVDTLALQSLVDQERARLSRLDAEMARNDDERLERSLIEQIELLLVSLDQTVQAAEEKTRASTARLEFARKERLDLQQSEREGAATDLEVLRSRGRRDRGRGRREGKLPDPALHRGRAHRRRHRHQARRADDRAQGAGSRDTRATA